MTTRIVGRRRSKKIRGAPGNTVTRGLILLKKPAEVDHLIGTIPVFDFGMFNMAMARGVSLPLFQIVASLQSIV